MPEMTHFFPIRQTMDLIRALFDPNSGSGLGYRLDQTTSDGPMFGCGAPAFLTFSPCLTGRGLTVCFPPQGAAVRAQGVQPTLWNWDYLSRYSGDPDVIPDHWP
jgi:hypothetical protein